MRHYPFHVGDYRSATSHLSDSEDLTYRRLIDHYYDTEQPISMDLPMVARRLRVSQADLVTVLQDFFTESEGAWHHARCDAELGKYHSFKESGKKGADKRWGNDREPIGSLPDPNATPIATKNQEPRTSNQEPIKPKAARKPAPDLPDCISPDVWQRWIDYRREIKKPLSPSTVNAQISKLTEMNARGVNPEQVIDTSILNGWIGLIEPKNGSNHGNGKQTRFDKLAATAAALTGSSQRTFDNATGRMD